MYALKFYTLVSSLFMYLHSGSTIGDTLSFHDLTISVALITYCLEISCLCAVNDADY